MGKRGHSEEEILRGFAAPQQATPTDAEAFAEVVVKMLRDSGLNLRG